MEKVRQRVTLRDKALVERAHCKAGLPKIKKILEYRNLFEEEFHGKSNAM